MHKTVIPVSKILTRVIASASLGLLFLLPQTASADIFSGLAIGQELPGEDIVTTKVLGDSAVSKTDIVFDESDVFLTEDENEEKVVEENSIGENILENINTEIGEEQKENAQEVEMTDGIVHTNLYNDYVVVDPEDAVEQQRLYLDAATIEKGYTVVSEADDFKAGIGPGSVSVPVTVVLKQIPAWHMSVDKTAEKISMIYEYDVRECVVEKEKCRDKGTAFFENTKSLGELDKKIVIAIKFENNNFMQKVVHYWDKPSQRWVPLDTTIDFENNLARAEIQFPYARIAVFGENHVQEGLASWYAFEDCMCAASHVYKRGTVLKVTNISGSPRHGNSILVTVNDYGPDPKIHPDRPIDLDKVAYASLAASLGSGLMMVRVEPVDPLKAEIYEWVDIKNGKFTQD